MGPDRKRNTRASVERCTTEQAEQVDAPRSGSLFTPSPPEPELRRIFGAPTRAAQPVVCAQPVWGCRSPGAVRASDAIAVHFLEPYPRCGGQPLSTRSSLARRGRVVAATRPPPRVGPSQHNDGTLRGRAPLSKTILDLALWPTRGGVEFPGEGGGPRRRRAILIVTRRSVRGHSWPGWRGRAAWAAPPERGSSSSPEQALAITASLRVIGGRPLPNTSSHMHG